MSIAAPTTPARRSPLFFLFGVLIALGTVMAALGGLVYFLQGGREQLFASSESITYTNTRGVQPAPAAPLPPLEYIQVNSTTSSFLDGANPRRRYLFNISQPGLVTIQLLSDFDNYLELYDATGANQLATDDDSGEGLNALLSRNLGPGQYSVLVRPYSDGTGPFTLIIMAPAETAAPTAPIAPPAAPANPRQPVNGNLFQ